MSNPDSLMPAEGGPVVEALGMDGLAIDPGAESGDAIDVEADAGLDADGVASADGTVDRAPSDAAPATQDSAAAETNGLP